MKERVEKYISPYMSVPVTLEVVAEMVQVIRELWQKNQELRIALEHYADASLWPCSNEFDGNSWKTAEQALNKE